MTISAIPSLKTAEFVTALVLEPKAYLVTPAEKLRMHQSHIFRLCVTCTLYSEPTQVECLEIRIEHKE